VIFGSGYVELGTWKLGALTSVINILLWLWWAVSGGNTSVFGEEVSVLI
jgi:hypothetical protein